MDPKPKHRPRQKHYGAQCLECIDNMPCAEYKLQILQETDTCNEGQIGAILLGAILRREGLYSSHLTASTAKTSWTTGGINGHQARSQAQP